MTLGKEPEPSDRGRSSNETVAPRMARHIYFFVGEHMTRILRLPGVIALNGLSRSTIYSHITQGLWPSPVSIGARAVGFPANECEAVIAARIAGKSEGQIRELVAKLAAARKSDNNFVVGSATMIDPLKENTWVKPGAGKSTSATECHQMPPLLENKVQP